MNLPVFNTAFVLVAFRSSVTFPRNDCGHNLSYTRVPDLLSVAAAREPYCCLSHPLGDQCDSVTYTVRIDSTPAYTALSVCTAFVPLFIYVALWYSLLDNRPGALRLRRRRHMRSTAWLPIDRKSNWRGAMITTSSELVMHNADAKCSHNSSHLERVQQLTVPRFWAIFLDRSAVGQLSAKGPCHFWSIDFQCWFTSSRWRDVVYTIDVV